MAIFTSSQEKRLWLYALIVLVAILSTLIMGRPLQEMLRDQNIQAIFFSLGMLLTGGAIIAHGLKVRPSNTEIAIWFGLAAVFIMFIFRLGAPERSHLMEYSVLAIFIHKAFIERVNQGKRIPMPGLFSFVIAFLIGVLDECIQLFLPNRVFDLLDILFNGFAVTMAIGTSVFITWVQKRIAKS